MPNIAPSNANPLAIPPFLAFNPTPLIQEKDSRRDQFAVLLTKSLYKPDVGLVWEDAEYLATEGLVI